MKDCRLVSFLTPKGIELHGLLFGPEKPKTVIIVVHGLSSSMLSNHDLFIPIANDTTAVLFFNNRGHDKVTRIKKIDKRKKKDYTSLLAGGAHEIFTDCADDIAGAVNFAESTGASFIHLAGHSTGCQKSVYYQYKKKDSRINSLILLAPISDYAGIKKELSEEDLENIRKVARTLINSGNPHTLLPQTIWPALDDAQRFLSLTTPKSAEEIFPYSHHERKAIELLSLKVPTLVILGEKDEYRDRPIKKIASWFEETLKTHHTLATIPNANHSFTDHSSQVHSILTSWLKPKT